jgi:transposase
VGALPIVNRIFERLKLEDWLSAYLPQPDRRCKIAPVEGLLLLLRNVLLCREPLYGIGEWADRCAPDLLGLRPGQIPALNDDRVGRCLDQLFAADCSSLILSIVGHAIREFGVRLDELHNDSTTVTFFGRYEGARRGASQAGKQTLAITWGHNKDHRPDLKQLLFVLTVAADGAVPVHFTAAHGNVTDDKTHQATWDLLCEISGRCDFLYVADSKLATTENMAYVHQRGGRFVTVLPRTRAEDKTFRGQVRAGAIRWKHVHTRRNEEGEIFDQFDICDEPMTTADGYRLLWYRSERTAETDAHARAQKIERAFAALARLRERLTSPRSRWRDRAKVESAVARILEDTGVGRWLKVEVLEIPGATFLQERPGRPGKDTRYVRSVRLRFDIRSAIDHEAVVEEALTDGLFPLVTNVTELSETDLLLAYKGQAQIEKRFSQLKTDFVVAPVFLKNVARIEALLCLYFLVLLVQALLEREVRQQIARHKLTSLPLYPEGRPCRAPSARRLIDVFDNIQRHDITSAETPAPSLVTELSPLQKQLLRMLHIPTATYGT